MPDGVLPGREFVAVVREPGHDELADATERELLVRRLQYGHGDQRYVTVGRLDGRPVAGARRLVAVFAARATRLCAGRRRLTAAASTVVVVVAPGRDGCRVIIVVVVGRIHVHVRRLGRSDAARRRHGRRRRDGLHHHGGSGSGASTAADAPQV